MGTRISVFLTDDENEKLEMAAEMAGFKKPKALKKMAFSNIENFKAWAELKPELETLVYELGKQGVNLNQIAKKLNEKYYIDGEAAKELEKTNRMFRRILIFRTEIIKHVNKKSGKKRKVVSDDS